VAASAAALVCRNSCGAIIFRSIRSCGSFQIRSRLSRLDLCRAAAFAAADCSAVALAVVIARRARETLSDDVWCWRFAAASARFLLRTAVSIARLNHHERSPGLIFLIIFDENVDHHPRKPSGKSSNIYAATHFVPSVCEKTRRHHSEPPNSRTARAELPARRPSRFPQKVFRVS